MVNNYKESFNQIRAAGSLAAETLDEVTSSKVSAAKQPAIFICSKDSL